MGCDIHCFAEYKIKGRWYFALEVDISRDYKLFGKMGYTGRDLEAVPLAPLRGMPENADFMTRFNMEHSADHSPSYLTGKEVIQLFEEYPYIQDLIRSGDSAWYSWSRMPDAYDLDGIEDFRWVFGFDN